MDDARSIAGKLSSLCCAVQLGRLNSRAWSIYGRYHSATATSVMATLHSDTVWWISQLEFWAASSFSDREFPILSASELLARPDKLQYNRLCNRSSSARSEGLVLELGFGSRLASNSLKREGLVIGV